MKRIISIMGFMSLILGIAPFVMATPVNSNSIIEDGIEYYMQTDKSIYDLGESVEMLFRVTNLGEDDVTFHFNDQVQYYFTVKQDENLIWYVPKAGAPMTSFFVLQPNGYKEYSETWDMINENGTPSLPDDDFPATPGDYEVTGSLHPVLLAQQDKDRYVPVSVQIEIIPEPATILLFGLSGFLLTRT
jgi:hypothetical protein